VRYYYTFHFTGLLLQTYAKLILFPNFTRTLSGRISNISASCLKAQDPDYKTV